MHGLETLIPDFSITRGSNSGFDRQNDPAGNRTKLVRTNPNTSNSPVTTMSSFYADNQIEQSVQSGPQQATVTTNYGEDNNGNLTSANSSSTWLTTYSYDFENRLKVVDLPAGTTVQFGYNPDGLRVQKTGTTGVVTDYVLDGLQILLEKNASGTTQTRYVPALATIVSGAPSYYLEDRMGSILGLANSSQSVTDTFVYDAWGNTIQRQGTNDYTFLWKGEFGYYMNTDFAQYLVGYRFYIPDISRFSTRGKWNSYPLNIFYNQYVYILNRSPNAVDPTGFVAQIVVIGAVVLVGIVAVELYCAYLDTYDCLYEWGGRDNVLHSTHSYATIGAEGAGISIGIKIPCGWTCECKHKC
jgi:YD repeat-containing protein